MSQMSQMSRMSRMSQMSQMSQMSLSLSLSGLKGRSLYFKSKSNVTKSSHMSRMSQMSQTCLLITLIKCLKGHKSLGSLGSVVKGLIVSLVGPRDQPTKGQGHLLSCSGQLKRVPKNVTFFTAADNTLLTD